MFKLPYNCGHFTCLQGNAPNPSTLPYSFTNFEPVHCSMSSSNHCFLTTFRFLRKQVRWSGTPISLRIFQFVVIHIVKGFSVLNKAEIDVLLEFPCFLYDTRNVDNYISASSAFSKSSLNIWKLTVYILLKPGLENLGHYFASVWDECNCAVVWTFFGIAFLWDWNENWPFPATAELSKFAGILSAALSQHHLSGFEIAQLEFHHLH